MRAGRFLAEERGAFDAEGPEAEVTIAPVAATAPLYEVAAVHGLAGDVPEPVE